MQRRQHRRVTSIPRNPPLICLGTTRFSPHCQNIAEDPELRARYNLGDSGFIKNCVFSMTPPDGASICLWTEGSFFSKDLNGGAGTAIWDRGYESIPKVITSAEGYVFSSGQTEMIAIAKALYIIASHYHGRSILLHSDSLSSFTRISSSYWQSSLRHRWPQRQHFINRLCSSGNFF